MTPGETTLAGEDCATASMLRSGWHVVHARFDLCRRRWRELTRDQQLQTVADYVGELQQPDDAVQQLVSWYCRTDATLGIMAMDPSLLRLERLRSRLRSIGTGDLVVPGPVLLSTTSVDERLFSVELFRARLIQQGVDPGSKEFVQEVASFEYRRAERIKAATQPTAPSHRNMAVIPFSARRDGPHNWFTLSEDERTAIAVASFRVAGEARPDVTQLFTTARGLCSYDGVLTLWAARADELTAYLGVAMATEFFARYVDLGPVTSGIVMSPREILELCGLV